MIIQIINWSRWVHQLTKEFKATLRWLTINSSQSHDRVVNRPKKTVSQHHWPPTDMFIWVHAHWRMQAYKKWESLAKRFQIKLNPHPQSSIRLQSSVTKRSLIRTKGTGRSFSQLTLCIWIQGVMSWLQNLKVISARESGPWQYSRRGARQEMPRWYQTCPNSTKIVREVSSLHLIRPSSCHLHGTHPKLKRRIRFHMSSLNS